MEPLRGTSSIPLSMVTVSAFFEVQLSVDAPPEFITSGLALNETDGPGGAARHMFVVP